MALKANYTLVTLNQLNPLSDNITIGNNDLFYLLKRDDSPSSITGYASEANKVTSAEIANYVINSEFAGSAATHDAGDEGGNVLLLPDNGIIDIKNLPLATNNTAGIISVDNINFTIEEGILNLKSELSNIESINSNNDLNLNIGGVLKINGEDVSKSLINNKVINLNATTIINISENDGHNPMYNLNGITKELLEANDNTIDINLDEIDEDITNFLSYKISLRIPEEINLLKFRSEANEVMTIVNPGSLYVLTLDILPRALYGKFYITVGIAQEISEE